MPPAQQRFQPDDAAGSEFNLRLVMELELAALDRSTQFVGDDHAFPHLAIEIGAVKPDAIAAVLLGAIEREIGLNHHRVRPDRFRLVIRYADADRDMNFIAGDHVGLREDGRNLIGERARCACIIGIGLQNRKLVPTDPGDDIVLANAGNGAGRDLPQQRIANGVAERVVDVLEMIEIEIKHGKGPGAAATCGERRAELRHESAPIDE